MFGCTKLQNELHEDLTFSQTYCTGVLLECLISSNSDSCVLHLITHLTQVDSSACLSGVLDQTVWYYTI